ncbi:MAG: hypothetical protein WC551_08255 [Patescibacteria group bacterium]
MALPTLADVFRVYVKPSLKGGVVIRKRTTAVQSAKKVTRMEAFASTAPGCVRSARGKPWKEYVAGLRTCMATLKTGSGPATVGRREYAKKFWKA